MLGAVDPAERQRAGLCADCAHAQRITSSRQSIFYRCRLADTDPQFSRYPALPVVRCSGYGPMDALSGGRTPPRS
jgi:hypothetical protein